MKNLLKATLLAGVSALAINGAAMAACSNGQQEYYTSTGTGTTLDPYVAHSNCQQVWSADNGGAATGNFKPVMVDNGSGVMVPLVVDGHAIVDGGVHEPFTKVNGTDGLAAGNGATVGSSAYVKQVGTAPSTDYVAGHCSTPGCTIGGIEWVEQIGIAASADYVPAHWETKPVTQGTALGAGSSVQHDHSTALGAGATSTDTHQVTLGTASDTISAPGITSQLSKDRQSGPLELVTTDANGHLASDGGALSHSVMVNTAAIADHETRITTNTAGIAATNTRLNTFTPTGYASTGTVENWAGNVNDTLASHGAAIDANTAGISHLNGLYSAQQGQIDAVNKKAGKALEAAAITASLPQLHFGPGDWISVGVGGADAGGTGAWALAAGALVRPNIMVGLKGGMSGSTGVIAATGSMSFGGGYTPLK